MFGGASPSSMPPLQSSSTLLHASATGPIPPAQASTPPWHIVLPDVHCPTSVPQAAPPPGLPSSVAPLQLSSWLLQVSAVGPMPPTQTSPPFWHCSVPNSHAPTLVPQRPPPPGLPSSIT